MAKTTKCIYENKSNMTTLSGASVPTHDAPIMNEHCKREEHTRNGLCSDHLDIQVGFGKISCCSTHRDILLRKKHWFGGWETVRDSCPVCDRRNIQGHTAPTTPMPQQTATSIWSPIVAFLSKMQMNERNDALFELQNLALNDNKKNVTIVKEGGIHTILSAMEIHSNHVNVQHCGCGVLMNLAENNDNKVSIVAAGGITMILSAMKKHPKNDNIQKYGCGALWKLAVNNYFSVAITAAGGITAILSAMKTHSSNANVQEYGCAALTNLALNDNNKVTIAEEGGITAILSAMKTHSSNANVQEYGCAALMNLAENENNKVAIANADGIFAVDSAMRNHSSNANVQENGEEALRILNHENLSWWKWSFC